MIDIERLYFIAAGESLRLIEKMLADRKVAREARWDFATSLGGCGSFGGDDWFGAVLLEKDVAIPDGWKLSKKYTAEIDAGKYVAIVPDTRKKVGKAADREMRDKRFLIPSPAGIFTGSSRFIGRYLCYVGAHKLGDKWVISVPKAGTKDDNDKDAQYIPPDAIPIKTSEYYRMKEEAEAAKTVAAV